jgi:uncharacterized peroxidase-related enzyme
MTFVGDTEWEGCLLEPRRNAELEKRLRKESGHVPGVIPYFSSSSWIPTALSSMAECLMTRVYIDPHLAGLAGLVVSQDSSCRYCHAEQRALMRILGFSQERISQIEADFLTAELDPHEKVALEFARRLSRSNPLPSETDKKPLRDTGFSEMAIKELAGIVALFVLFNRVSTLPALPPQRMEAFPDKWYVRLLRPFIARRVRSMQRRGKPETLSDGQKTGPFSYLILALNGLPLAGELRRVLDRMWRSPILTDRCRALIFAVVARALGCPRSEEESVIMLLEEGLDRTDINEILSHLASPKLSPVESVIVPFARETVWYQAGQIQRRTRKVQEDLSTQQFLELIAVVSIANAVCRLGIIVDEGK